MRRIALLMIVTSGGCFTNDQLKSAAPSLAQTKINVPLAAGGSSGSSARPLTIGQTATFYEVTRGIAFVVNTGVGIILGTMEAIVANPPSARTATHAEWGPYTPALSPVTWKFDVDRVDADDYRYLLAGKPKQSDDSAYKIVIAGSAHVTGIEKGSGDFVLDFSTAHALDPGSLGTGQISVHYDNSADPRVVEVGFKSFADGNGSFTPDDALYRYAEHVDGSGNFEFVTRDDVDHDPAGTPEIVTLTSRWLASGQGRSDGSATGGSVIGTARLEECWSASFARTYYTNNVDAGATEGDPSSCIPLP